MSLRDFKSRVERGERYNPYGISAGYYNEAAAVHKFGRNRVVGTATAYVWDGGATAPVFPAESSAAALTIASDVAADSGVSSGVASMLITGLTSGYVLQTETVSLTGITPVTTVNEFIRLFQMEPLDLGDAALYNSSNAGTIIASHSAGMLAQISSGMGQTLMAVYTVPASKTLYINQLRASILKAGGTTGLVDFGLYESHIEGCAHIKHSWGLDQGGTSFSESTFKPPYKFTQKTDVYIKAEANQADTDVSAQFCGALIDNANGD